MPRFFFNVIDTKAIVDEDGLDCIDAKAAREAAVALAGEVLMADGHRHWRGDQWGLTVHDQHGRLVWTLNLTATAA